jgi:mitochondrial-processing peptidase subunit beta
VSEHVVLEWIRLSTTVTDFEVQRAKNTLKTSILNQYAEGGMSYACEEIGRQVLSYGRRMPVDELLTRIEQVTAKQVRDVCFSYIYNRDPSLGSFGPVEGLTDYLRMRGNMYWLRT